MHLAHTPDGKMQLPTVNNMGSAFFAALTPRPADEKLLA
jgi:hypothetical protein